MIIYDTIVTIITFNNYVSLEQVMYFYVSCYLIIKSSLCVLKKIWGFIK
jgi:hypothetical protein